MSPASSSERLAAARALDEACRRWAELRPEMGDEYRYGSYTGGTLLAIHAEFWGGLIVKVDLAVFLPVSLCLLIAQCVYADLSCMFWTGKYIWHSKQNA